MLRKIFGKATGKTEQQMLDEDLRRAAIKGNFARVKKLVAEGATVDYKDVNGMTPLSFAANRDNLDITRFLLEAGADPNNAGYSTYGPPLVQAAFRGNTAMVELLLDFKADIGAANYSGRTALHEAASRGMQETGIVLLERGASPNSVDRMGSTPLRDAMVFGFRALSQKLAECGADGSVEYKYGDDLRKRAVQQGWDDIVDALDACKTKAAAADALEKAALDKNVAKADTLQNTIAVKKPIAFKPK